MINKKISLISLFFLSQFLHAGSFRANPKNGSYSKKPVSSYASKVSIKQDNQVNSSSLAADNSVIIDRRTLNRLQRDLVDLKRDIKKLNNAVIAGNRNRPQKKAQSYISLLFSRFFSRSDQSEKK